MKLLLCGYGGYQNYLDKYLINKDIEFPFVFSLENVNLEDFINITDIDEHNRSLPTILSENERKRIYVPTGQGTNVAGFSIVEVDTTRKWGLDEYDGALSIKYFEEPTPINKEFNYYMWK